MRRRKRFLLVGLFLLGAGPASAQELWLRLATTAGLGPFEDLVRAVYTELNIRVEFVELPLERSMVESDSGRLDGQLLRGTGTLRGYDNLVFTSEPLSTDRLEAWGPVGSQLRIRSAEELAKLKVGIVVGSKVAQQYIDDHGLRAEEMVKQDSLYKMLQNGRIEVALIPSIYRVGSLPPPGTLLNDNLMEVSLFHVLNKKHTALVADFDRVLRAMKTNGTYAGIFRRAPGN